MILFDDRYQNDKVRGLLYMSIMDIDYIVTKFGMDNLKESSYYRRISICAR